MDKLRLRFTKKGRAVYISHLDLMRTIQRAFMRSEIPLRYSEGFNPHAIMSFALPMSLGMSSDCELMDFKLREFMAVSEIAFRLNRSLPEGIEVLEAYEWERKFKEIKWLNVECFFRYDERSAEALIGDLMDFFNQDEIIIEKKTKKGMGMHDIAPAIKGIGFDIEDNSMCLNVTVSAQEPTLNPEHLVTALQQLAPELAPDFATFRRVDVFDSEMSVFR